MNRRRFVNVFFGGSFLATLGAFLYPVVRYLLPPQQAEAVQKKVVAAKVGDLPPNAAKVFKFGSTAGILINTSDGKLLAFSATCTHLTCTVTWQADTSTMYCPCHNGRFDLAGQVISGPPPAPLEPYQVDVVGEDIVVSKKG
jgi:cytochrome b6-f complex iron-sulfur subunit